MYTSQELITIINETPGIFNGIKTLTFDFKDWLTKNIHVFNEFERYAVDLKTNGRKDKYSARAIIQRLRWDTYFQENDSEWKISNTSTPYMSRLVMHINPFLNEMFRTKG